MSQLGMNISRIFYLYQKTRLFLPWELWYTTTASFKGLA